MNKLAIFDLDGVLADLKSVHFDALNKALIQCGHDPISHDDHLARFDGLPTRRKLQILDIEGQTYSDVLDIKQAETMHALPRYVKPNPELAKLLHEVYAAGYLLAVVSNACQETAREVLKLLSVEFLFAWVVTPDLYQQSPKPSPEMHMALMVKANACPMSTIIFEDSPAGLRAAHASGCKVVQVSGELKRWQVEEAIRYDYWRATYRYQWDEMVVLIPAAGKGQRFVDAGYSNPKPLIDVEGETMLQRVTDNLGVQANFRFVFLNNDLNKGLPKQENVKILAASTDGTARTCLEFKHKINNQKPLLIANCDQILEWDHLAFYYFCQSTSLDAVIVTFDCPDKSTKWSYCEMNPDGTVAIVAEKEPISTVANCGLFWFKHGSDFVKYAERMIQGEMRVKGEYFISPLFNLMIAENKRIGTFRVDRFWSLGTPADLETYLKRNEK